MQAKRIALLLLAVFLLACGPHATAGDDAPLARASAASNALATIMQAPDRELPADMLNNAYAVAVLPHVVKAGLVVAGRYGKGLVSIKQHGQWTNPSFVRLSGGSIGVQAGVSSTDLVLIFRSQRGVDSIVNGTFLLGTDLTVAAGPVGRNAQASTNAQLKAEIYAYSRARGLFAGFALQGSRLRIDHEANRAVYGPAATARSIYAATPATVPAAVAGFRARLEEYTTR